MLASLKALTTKKGVLLIIPLVLFISAVAGLYGLTQYFRTHLFPNTQIAGINVGGLTVDEARQKLSREIAPPTAFTLMYQERDFDLDLTTMNFSYDVDATLQTALHPSGSQTRLAKITSFVDALSKGHSIPLVMTIDEGLLNEHLLVIADELTSPAIEPQAVLENGEVLITEGVVGSSLDTSLLQEEILLALKTNAGHTLTLDIIAVDPRLNEAQKKSLLERATALSTKTMTISHEHEEFVYEGEDLFAFLSAYGGLHKDNVKKEIEEIKQVAQREPQNSVFVFENNRVQEFTPSKDGIAVKQNELMDQIALGLMELEGEEELFAFVLPVVATAPEITTQEVNDLGISELIGRGTSQFRGSISSRIHNIGVAAEDFNGVLVAPDEVLSFNAILGDVSTLTGYKQAYVIRDGQTVLGDGGGVCQVSTTLFRAVLDAGLPITERRSHSYRVTYYEQDSPPGLDATIYSPTTDFKFKNDTGHHMLVQTIYDPAAATLVFELYGTSDGRVATLTKPIVTSSSPPPEDLYQDDPTLPAGTVKQIDWAAWGAKVQFDYTVTRAGEEIYHKTFYSNYQPWQAKFLRGTGPAL